MDIFSVLPTLAQALAIVFALTTARISIQIQHHVFNLMGRTVHLALSIRRSSGGPTRTGWGLH